MKKNVQIVLRIGLQSKGSVLYEEKGSKYNIKIKRSTIILFLIYKSY